MLKRINRLSGKDNFKGGYTISSDLFSLKISSGQKNDKKFGFVISKKVDKKAVVRNRVKRQLAQCTRDLIDTIKTGNTIVVIAKKNILSKSQEEICLALGKELKDKRLLI